MKIIHTQSNDFFVQAANVVQNALETLLKSNGRFVLFLSGGSAVGVYKELIPWVVGTPLDLSKSTALLVDERYSIDPKHFGSNARVIEESGFFDALRSRNVGIETILQGFSLEKEVQAYDSFLQKLLTANSQLPAIVAVFGIGTDGHTAGIFPVSSHARPGLAWLNEFQTRYESGALVVGHSHGPEPFADRITLTPKALSLIDHVFLVAQGERKKEALERFLNASFEDRFQTPAVVLKEAKNLTIITDQEIG